MATAQPPPSEPGFLTALKKELHAPRGFELWRVLTALRGPDYKTRRAGDGPNRRVSEIKHRTTAVIRAVLFPFDPDLLIPSFPGDLNHTDKIVRILHDDHRHVGRHFLDHIRLAAHTLGIEVEEVAPTRRKSPRKAVKKPRARRRK